MAPFIRIQDAGDHSDLGWLRADQLVKIDADIRYATWPGLNTSRSPLGDVMIHAEDRSVVEQWLRVPRPPDPQLVE